MLLYFAVLERRPLTTVAPGATLHSMKESDRPAPKPRTFKTRWFAKEATKEGITDAQLCKAMDQVRNGQANRLGAGVFKNALGRTCTVASS